MTAAACSAPTCTNQLRDHETDAGQRLCTPCAKRLHRWLRSIPDRMTLLEASRERETSGQPPVTGTRTAPLPGREDVLNLLGPAATSTVSDEHGDQCGTTPVAGVLRDWARLITEEHPTTRRPAEWTILTLAAWLAERTWWITLQPWADELYDEVHDMMRTIWSATSDQPRRRPVPQPCPVCDSCALSRVDWEAHTSCGECGAWFTDDELALGAAATLARTAA
ncbi:hypothetical protein [Streptomyces uncialis]|uniref:hypothetical protein n=1 Tax=Streptomyces uncialis TaxID=1048205 RepID=UPI0033F0FF95